MSSQKDSPDSSPRRAARRRFVRSLAYAAPAMLSLKAAPSLAQVGSARDGKQDPGGIKIE